MASSVSTPWVWPPGGWAYSTLALVDHGPPADDIRDDRERHLPHGRSSLTHLHTPTDFRRPPASADQQEAPVREELGGLAFEGMAYELEHPAHQEESQG